MKSKRGVLVILCILGLMLIPLDSMGGAAAFR